MTQATKKPRPFPSKKDILAFIDESPTPVGKREIARAFRISGADRVELKAVLKDLKAEGLVEPGQRRRVGRKGSLPEVTVIEVAAVTGDGDVLAKPARWESDDAPPRIYLAPERRDAAGPGDRVLARLSRQPDGSYRAKAIKRLAAMPSRVLGVYELSGDGGAVRPVDRRDRAVYAVVKGDSGGARPGDLVMADQLRERGPLGRRVKVTERLGRSDAPGAISLIAVHHHSIPTEFTHEALAQAKRAKPATARGRADLRKTPLITIDGADARDFDDAVWAEPDRDAANSGGWRLIVAIADVAHYVRPDDPLDQCAYERGNSTYFPDRVVPMLPEALSNDLCSLKPGQDRACIAAHIWIDAEGRIRRHQFERSLMRSAARLTYEQVQAAMDGRPDDVTGPVLKPVIEPLYGAYQALAAARDARETLALELPERAIVLGPDGAVERVAPVHRLDSHRLIEEFMITANIAAAEKLENRGQPCMYRVHATPDPAKLEALRQVLHGLGYKLAKGQVLQPRHFNQILLKSAQAPHARLVHEMILRSQSRAAYSPDNDGHFGLALRRYAHFTSPIRRYSDLLVHRALLGGAARDGIGPEEGALFAERAEHISQTERRSMAAERDAADRYIAEFLADQVGARFTGAVTGVNRFGLFVALDDTGADGLVPIRTLPDDYYDHDEKSFALTGRNTGTTYRLGDDVEVRLAEANPLTGGLILELTDAPSAGANSGARAKQGKRNVKRRNRTATKIVGRSDRAVKRKARNHR